MERFKGKYRVASARLPEWDYAQNGAYFVTICTALRIHAFGEIEHGQMVCTPLGQAVADAWNEITVHFPVARVDAFIVMPNHVHGIIVIDKPVEPQNIASPPPGANQFGPQRQNLAAIVRGYKIGVTKFARQNQMVFSWQERYHEHVIRNPEEHERIWNYIHANPQGWAEDQLFSA